MKFLGISKPNKFKIPEIKIIECEMLNNNYVTFEYEMIHRAREAECVLNQMLYNGKYMVFFHQIFLLELWRS